MKVIKVTINWIITILIAFTLAILINVFVFQQLHVQGYSMEPTLQENDRVFVSKLINVFHYEPEYGDIIIIDSQTDVPRTLRDDFVGSLKNNLITNLIFETEKEEKYWIKRVIGKSGDVIEFKDGEVIRNGEELVESYIKEEAYYPEGIKIIVTEDHVFVMGDNRNYSKDSRNIGSVPIDHIVGIYKFKY